MCDLPRCFCGQRVINFMTNLCGDCQADYVADFEADTAREDALEPLAGGAVARTATTSYYRDEETGRLIAEPDAYPEDA